MELMPVFRLVRFQHTAARRRLANEIEPIQAAFLVSTHSRPKAAGGIQSAFLPPLMRFNTQPPEGGWMPAAAKLSI